MRVDRLGPWLDTGDGAGVGAAVEPPAWWWPHMAQAVAAASFSYVHAEHDHPLREEGFAAAAFAARTGAALDAAAAPVS